MPGSSRAPHSSIPRARAGELAGDGAPRAGGTQGTWVDGMSHTRVLPGKQRSQASSGGSAHTLSPGSLLRAAE